MKARFYTYMRKPLELIETLKWDGGFVRADAHLARMAISAKALGLSFREDAARAALDQAVQGRDGPSRVRLTLDERGTHKAAAYELLANPQYWTYVIAPERTDSADALLRHKVNWRELYDREHSDVDEVVFCNERGEPTEGARSNIFIKRGGMLLTPPLDAGVLPGVLRAEVIARGKAREATLTPADLDGEVWFGNSLRGLIRAVRP